MECHGCQINQGSQQISRLSKVPVERDSNSSLSGCQIMRGNDQLQSQGKAIKITLTQAKEDT